MERENERENEKEKEMEGEEGGEEEDTEAHMVDDDSEQGVKLGLVRVPKQPGY